MKDAKPDEIYSYGMSFIAERKGKHIDMYRNLVWVDALMFETEELAITQMQAWEELGRQLEGMMLNG